MPDRIIRDELLESEAFLSLKDNADRLAYISILLRCDTLGNMPAGPFRLMRLWRDWGIGTEPLVAKTLEELTAHGLVRLYEAAGKRYLHVPRFRQRSRYLGRLFPISPWTTDEEKQAIADYSPGDSQVRTGRSPAGVGVGVGVGVEEKLKSKVKSLAVAGSRLPPTWELPEDWKSWAMNLTGWDDERTIRESLVFRDYWHSKAGADSRKVDWLATWRNWIRRAQQ